MSAQERAAFSLTRANFPARFRFGTATSAYQIEGSSFGNCGPSHWDTFAATPGNVERAEDGAVACDHYHRWPEDLDLVRDAGFDAYRFSVSWSRVQPEGRGAANPEGLDFYDRLVDGMLERGLDPFLTLYHWELPAPLATLGGWQNREIADRFADYTEIVMHRLGDRIATAATFNEPWCITWLSHFLGHHAPGLRDIRAAAHSMHHVLLAHGRAVTAMRALGIGNIGLVTNFEYAQPADDSAASKAAARLHDGIYNRWFIQAVRQKSYPQDVLAGLEPHMPPGWEKDFDMIGQEVDWLGINYYTRKLIAADPATAFPSLCEVDGPLPKTQTDWEIYPEGLHHFLTWLHHEHGRGLPIHVTENGMANADTVIGGAINDVERIAYIDAHLKQVLTAIEEGVPVKSYFVWSLLDNYEWALGYDKRFGLVHVDFESFKRSPKASWQALSKVLAR